MKKRTLFISTIFILVFAAVVALLAWKHLIDEADHAASENTDTEIQHTEHTDSQENLPSPTSSSTAPTVEVPYGDADQAAERPTASANYKSQEIIQPSPQAHLDRNDVKAVVIEAITLYTSRTSATDTTYQKQLEGLTTEVLQQEIFSIRLKAFDGKFPVAVHDVTLGENISEWGIDTPMRYSHYATATVATADSGNYQVQYRIAATKMQDGWTVTDLAIDSWRRTV